MNKRELNEQIFEQILKYASRRKNGQHDKRFSFR